VGHDYASRWEEFLDKPFQQGKDRSGKVDEVIVVVCSDKGAPGVTTLATVLALAWPSERVLLEADPSGGDLSLRMRAPETPYLAREPTLLSLAMAVRSGARGDGLPEYAQDTSLGVAVIPGPPSAQAWTPMLHLWSQVAARIQEWAGTVIIDVGRLQPGHPGMALVAVADAVLLLTTATVDGLFHARERAQELEQVLGERSGRRSPVGVVVRASGKDKRSLTDVGQVLQNLVPVIGGFADDPGGIQALLAGTDTAELRRSALMRSAVELVARIRRTWPEPEAPFMSQFPARAPVRLLRDTR
jgi:MinD-like ATPase involved in chromosome partitioning or flagellar assembly